MPILDAIFVGKIHLPEVGGGPIIPPGQPPGQPPVAGWPPVVMPPIFYPPTGGGQPPGFWGPPGPWPTPPIVIPPDSLAPGVPSHPIVIQPPGIWGPTDPRPTPPIFLPPTGGSPPLGIWGGGNVPMPTPPIYLPPGQELPTSFTVIVRNNTTGEWKAMKFVPGDVPPAQPPTTPGPKES